MSDFGKDYKANSHGNVSTLEFGGHGTILETGH